MYTLHNVYIIYINDNKILNIALYSLHNVYIIEC